MEELYGNSGDQRMPMTSNQKANMRASMQAERLKKYQQFSQPGSDFAPGVGGFATKPIGQPPMRRPVPQVHKKESKQEGLFNPKELDEPSDIKNLPELKPSSVKMDVLLALIVGNLCD